MTMCVEEAPSATILSIRRAKGSGSLTIDAFAIVPAKGGNKEALQFGAGASTLAELGVANRPRVVSAQCSARDSATLLIQLRRSGAEVATADGIVAKYKIGTTVGEVLITTRFRLCPESSATCS